MFVTIFVAILTTTETDPKTNVTFELTVTFTGTREGGLINVSFPHGSMVSEEDRSVGAVKGGTNSVKLLGLIMFGSVPI
jgi:NAD(P)H-flavin reductase